MMNNMVKCVSIGMLSVCALLCYNDRCHLMTIPLTIMTKNQLVSTLLNRQSNPQALVSAPIQSALLSSWWTFCVVVMSWRAGNPLFNQTRDLTISFVNVVVLVLMSRASVWKECLNRTTLKHLCSIKHSCHDDIIKWIRYPPVTGEFPS